MLPQVCKIPFKPFWDETLSNRDYHAMRNFMSSSGLKPFEKSALAGYSNWMYPDKKQTETQRFGTAVHDYIQHVIIGGREYDLMPDFGDMRSTVNREKKRVWLDEHASSPYVVDRADVPRLDGVANALNKHVKFKALIHRGEAEHSGFFRDPDTGILCRIRPDFYNSHYGILVDYKTCQDVNQAAVSRDIWTWKYHLSAYFYIYGIEQITGVMPRKFVFAFIETNPPFDVVLYEADEGMLEKGRLAYSYLMSRLKTGLETNQWPGVAEKIVKISLPAWALKEEYV